MRGSKESSTIFEAEEVKDGVEERDHQSDSQQHWIALQKYPLGSHSHSLRTGGGEEEKGQKNEKGEGLGITLMESDSPSRAPQASCCWKDLSMAA